MTDDSGIHRILIGRMANIIREEIPGLDAEAVEGGIVAAIAPLADDIRAVLAETLPHFHIESAPDFCPVCRARRRLAALFAEETS